MPLPLPCWTKFTHPCPLPEPVSHTHPPATPADLPAPVGSRKADNTPDFLPVFLAMCCRSTFYSWRDNFTAVRPSGGRGLPADSRCRIGQLLKDGGRHSWTRTLDALHAPQCNESFQNNEALKRHSQTVWDISGRYLTFYNMDTLKPSLAFYIQIMCFRC